MSHVPLYGATRGVTRGKVGPFRLEEGGALPYEGTSRLGFHLAQTLDARDPYLGTMASVQVLARGGVGVRCPYDTTRGGARRRVTSERASLFVWRKCCDPKGSMVFLQNNFRCPPMLGARGT